MSNFICTELPIVNHVDKLPENMRDLFAKLDNDILQSFTVPSYALVEGVRGQAPQQGSFGNGQAIGGIVGTPLTQVVNAVEAIGAKATKLVDDTLSKMAQATTIEGYLDDVEVMSTDINPLELIADRDDCGLIEYQNIDSARKDTNELAFMNSLVASWNGSIGNLDKDSHNLKEFRKGFDSLV